MKTPPFIIGLSLLFWGWQTRLFWVALIMIPIVEGARFIRSKWDFSTSDFNKVTDLCTILLAVTIVSALALKPEKAIIITVTWLPVILFPLIAVQEYSFKGKIDIKALFIVARRRNKTLSSWPMNPGIQKIDISYLYAGFCLISAGMGNIRNITFYLCIIFIISASLLPLRVKRYSSITWVLLMSLAAAVGFAGHKGIDRLSLKINDMIMDYYLKYSSSDPFRRTTGLGDIGELKLSSKILFRVKFPDNDVRDSMLLREASYNKYGHTSWYAVSRFINMKPLPATDKEGTLWQLNPYDKKYESLIFYSRYGKEKTLLKLPLGSFQIKELKAKRLKKNGLGTISAENAPALIKGLVHYNPNLSFDSPAGQYDLHIPRAELETIHQIKSELDLDSKTLDEKLAAVKKYFLTRFSYSLKLSRKKKGTTFLENFLKNSKSGHCEFFATATVLLLRSAGVPARYATGFMVHEYSPMENMHVVRLKDAHAWAMVERDGKWEHFDTTPPSWLTVDSDTTQNSVLQDLSSWLFFNLSKLRHETGADLFKRYGLWLILPLALFLFFRLRSDKGIERIRTGPSKDGHNEIIEPGSCFYQIEKALNQLGYERLAGETYATWFKRLKTDSVLSLDFQTLHHYLKIYEKERFSKIGISKEEKKLLKKDLDAFIESLSALQI